MKRRINRENPWFTIFDYSEHDPAEVWMLLPEELKPYTGMGLIASYKARADRVIDYMLDEDAKGYYGILGRWDRMRHNSGSIQSRACPKLNMR